MAHLRYIYLVIFITMSVARLVSSIAGNKRNNLRADRSRNFGRRIASSKTDPNYSTRWTVEQHKSLANSNWVDMEIGQFYEDDLSDPSTIPKIIRLRYKTAVFGHDVTEVEVLREGGIRSADPNLQWNAIPLKIQTFDELKPCPIKYGFHDDALAIQWNFGHRYCRNGVELSFQLHISPNGKMFFIYKKIPYGSLQNTPHIAHNFGVRFEFKVPGSNDTFDLGFQLKISETDIKNNTVILVEPLSLCANHQDKGSCVAAGNFRPPLLPCFWCPEIGICSNKTDFLKNVWFQNNCEPKTKFEIEFNSYSGKGNLLNCIMACSITILSVLLIFVCYKTVIHLKKKWFPLSQFRTVVIWSSSSADDVQILYLQQDEYNLSRPLRQNLLEPSDSSLQGSVHGCDPPTPSSTPSSTPPPPYDEHDVAVPQLVDAEIVSRDDPLVIRVNDQQADLDDMSHVLIID